MEGASAYTAEEFVEMFESEVTLINKILPATTTGILHMGTAMMMEHLIMRLRQHLLTQKMVMLQPDGIQQK